MLQVSNKITVRGDNSPCVLDTTLYTTCKDTYSIHRRSFHRTLANVYNSGDQFVMSIDNPSLTASKGSKCYTLFPTYIDAFIWLESIPLVNRNCYEIIPAGPQKPHFDIDIPIDKIQPGQDITIVSADVMTHITSAIERVFLSHNVNYHKDRNLLVFSSHGPAKRSFHIIIDGLYHSDNKQAKIFYLLVINELPGHLRQYVDGSVYSRNQNFRLLNNQKKVGSKNY